MKFRKTRQVTKELNEKVSDLISHICVDTEISKAIKKAQIMQSLKDKTNKIYGTDVNYRELGQEIRELDQELRDMNETPLTKNRMGTRKLKDIAETGGPVFRKWKRTSKEMEDLRKKLLREDIDYVTDYFNLYYPTMATNIINEYTEQHPDHMDNEDYHMSILKNMLIDEFMRLKGEEVYDDSDLIEDFHKNLEFELPRHIKSKLYKYDSDKLFDIMNRLYEKYYEKIKGDLFRKEILRKMRMFEYDIAFGSKTEEELVKDAVNIIANF